MTAIDRIDSVYVPAPEVALMSSCDMIPPDKGNQPRTTGSGVLTRRSFVGSAFAAALASTIPLPKSRVSSAGATESDRAWSSAEGWGGSMPSSEDVVVIRDRVILDSDTKVGGLVIEAGGALVFEESKSVSLVSRGSVVVLGVLQMAPSSRRWTHVLRFEGIDEARIVGGEAGGPETDVGLWVRGRGRLLFNGSSRTAWVRAEGDLRRGTSRIRLREAPVGWKTGDELVVTPTAAADSARPYDQFDTVRIRSVSGRTVRVTPRLRFDHPEQSIGRGTVTSAEVMNVTRNVRVEGQPGGRAHVYIRGDVPQRMWNFSLRYVGPRKLDGASSQTVLGRYGLHFDMAGDATRGTLVAGAVVRDCGSHAYVPHASHGITFRSCISHDTMDDAYWWDAAPDTRNDQKATHRLTYEACIASRVTTDPPFRGFRLTGFSLGRGHGNRALGCVAVGIQGNVNASGFLWPEGGVGLWQFADCVAHNNKVNGIFVWQNTNLAHVVKRFLGYHNGQAGIEHGAYVNGYTYKNSILYGNGDASVRLHALSSTERRLTIDNLWCDGAGVSQHGIQFVRHTLRSTSPIVIKRSMFRGHRAAAVALLATEGPLDLVDLVDCTVEGNELVAADSWVGGRVRWVDPKRGAFRVLPKSAEGQFVPRWNAVRKSIPRFAKRLPSPRSGPIAMPPSAPPT